MICPRVKTIYALIFIIFQLIINFSYSNFMSFLDNGMPQMVRIYSHLREEFTYSTKSISWGPFSWRCNERARTPASMISTLAVFFNHWNHNTCIPIFRVNWVKIMAADGMGRSAAWPTLMRSTDKAGVPFLPGIKFQWPAPPHCWNIIENVHIYRNNFHMTRA